MAKAIFTHSVASSYDDLPEERYHFPRTYLKVAEQAVGDLILYYEPRRSVRADGSAGRQGYFAVAQVTAIEPDLADPTHFYARISDYLDFERVVPFREASGHYYESLLRKADGSTNKGAFGAFSAEDSGRGVRRDPPVGVHARTGRVGASRCRG